MRSDINNDLNIMEQGATMSEEELEQAEKKVEDECASYKDVLAKLTEEAGKLLTEASEKTSDLMNEVLKVMKNDTGSLKSVDKDDLIRYYPFYCMDKLQDSIDLCFSYDVFRVTDLLMNQCGEDATQILDQSTSANLGISFHIDNQTWTRGDDIGFVGRQFNLGLLTYVIDGVAGTIRNKELKGKTNDVLEQILAQYDGLRAETLSSVSNAYQKLQSELSTKLNLYYQNRILDAQDRLNKAKEVAALGSKKKEQIFSTAGYVRKLLQVMLMGGEPLMAFPMIKELVEWVIEKENQWHRECFFFGSTNGTLLDDKMKKWFHLYREHVTLALSFDGLPKAQNKNRCCSADLVDLGFFQQNWPNQKVQMTISEDTVDQMAAGVIFLLEKGFQVNPSVAYEDHEWSEKAIEEYLKQMIILKDYYLTHPSAPLIYQFKHPLIAYAGELENPTVQQQQCGAGCGFTMFDIDKKMYPCHMMSPLVLSEEQLIKLDGIDMRYQTFQDERCVGCPYISACATCAGCNYLYRGDFSIRDTTHCKIQQLEVLVCLRYQVSKINQMPDLGDKETVDAICRLNAYISE